MFEQYLEEEYGKEVIKCEEGFAAYILNKEAEEIFLSDIYILPEHRKTIASKKLFSRVVEIGLEHGCKVLTGHVSFPKDLEGRQKKSKLLRCYLSLGMTVFQVGQGEMVLEYKID